MQYTIYILAEGKSSRMGKDKGLVKINEKEMIAHCIAHVKPLLQEIKIITSNTAYDKFDLPIISDSVKNNGPAQGIITALENSKTEKNLILSCDMPLVNDLMIRGFDNLIMNSDIVCYEDEYLCPFPGVYSKSILPKWKAEVAAGNNKLQHLVRQFNYKTLPIEHPALFLNVNTPADLNLAAEKLK